MSNQKVNSNAIQQAKDEQQANIEQMLNSFMYQTTTKILEGLHETKLNSFEPKAILNELTGEYEPKLILTLLTPNNDKHTITLSAYTAIKSLEPIRLQLETKTKNIHETSPLLDICNEWLKTPVLCNYAKIKNSVARQAIYLNI